MELDRRTFLKTGAWLGAAGLAGPRLASGYDYRAGDDKVVVVFLRGGLDPLQAVPPYADNDYRRLRPTISVPPPGQANGMIALDGLYGLHPSLAPLIPLYENKRLAVVHATGLKHNDRSHFSCQDHIETGILGLAGSDHPAHSGWLSRHAVNIGNPGGFYAVGMGSTLPISLRGGGEAVALGDISQFGLRSRSDRHVELQDEIYRLFGRDNFIGKASRNALDNAEYLAAVDPGALPAHANASYPPTLFGNHLRQVAQLIKADMGLRVACVDLGNFDHHADINSQLPLLLAQLARGLAAFDTDMGAAMSDITLITISEFGRRAYENASGGTDHGCGSMMLLMGGGVRGGQVYAEWPGLADSQLFNGDLDVTIDYRTVLRELLLKRMGGLDDPGVFTEVARAPSLGCFRHKRVRRDRRLASGSASLH